MNEKFKISGIGIDTTEINQLLPTEALKDFTYVHTSISSGNDTIIYNSLNPESILITTIDFLDKSEIAISTHLQELNRSSIDLLLIDSKCKFEDNIDTLNTSLISGFVKELGISNPTSIDDIENALKYISQISYVSLNICPLNFPWSIIKYCREKGIKILGFNQFGGYINAPRLIESFSVPYLLAFSAVYSDIVFLSGRKLSVLDNEIEYLSELIDKEYDKEFSMFQDVYKLFKNPKKTVNTTIKITPEIEIPYESAETIFSFSEIRFGLSSNVYYKIPEIKENLDELETMVHSYYDNFSGGPSDNNTPENTLSILRPRILDLARVQYLGEDGWIVFCTKLSKMAFVISAVKKVEEKKFLKKSKETKEQVNYILYFDGSNFLFQNIKNAI